MATTALLDVRCARGTCRVSAEDVACPLCRERLEAAVRRPAGPARPTTCEAPPPPPREAHGRWLVLGVGVLLAPVLTLTPLLRYVGRFLASLGPENDLLRFSRSVVHTPSPTAAALLLLLAALAIVVVTLGRTSRDVEAAWGAYAPRPRPWLTSCAASSRLPRGARSPLR